MICNVFPDTLSRLLLALCPNITSSGIQFATAQSPLLELMDCRMTVSYKWLSHNFLVSSNGAKRLLQDFVEKNESKSEVVYTLSGWLKNNSSVYHIRLVSRAKLEDFIFKLPWTR